MNANKTKTLDTSYLNKMHTYTFHVERGKLHEFCLAIRETNPIYLDVAAAQASGYDDTPVTPTFLTSAIFWGYPQLWDIIQKVGFDLGRMVHLKENMNYHKPIYPNMTINIEIGLTDIKDGKMKIGTMHARFTNEQNELLATTDMVMTMRPE